MATYTDNYNLIKPTYAETADIVPLNNNFEKIDEVMHASQTSLAPAYDQTASYQPGDVVMYELNMYKCTGATSGTWDPSKWTRTTAAETGGGGSVDFDIFGEGSGSVVTITDGAEAGLAECIAEIEVTQSGSGTPSPSNVRPIVGRSEVNVSVSGKNKNAYPYVAGTRVISDVSFTMNNDGTITLSGTATAQADYILNGAWASSNNILPSGNYKTYIGDNIPNGIELICVYNTTRLTPVDNVINAPNGITYSFIRIANGTNTNGIKLFPMITLSTAPEGFEPYITPEVTTIPLDRTVYGGTLDSVTGKLIVTHGIVDLGDLDWTYNSSSGEFVSTTSPDNIKLNMAYNPQAICSEYEVVAWQSGTGERIFLSNASRIYGKGFSVTTPSDFESLMEGVMLVYELATPQTYTLTPEEVSTILGYNNISADTGDVSVVYVKQTAPIKPNPTGADIPLTGIEIDGEKFSINVIPKTTELWSNNSGFGVGTYPLNDDINNYDFIEIYYGVYSEYNDITDSKIVSVDAFKYLHNLNKKMILTGYENRVVYCDMYNSTLSITTANSNTILRVVGIKF